MKLHQMVLAALGVLAPVTMTIGGVNRVAQVGEAAPVSSGDEQSSTSMAKLTSLNGVSRLITIEGVGCTRSICSRTHINGTSEHEGTVAASHDSIAFIDIDAIQNTTPNRALFLLKDGTRQRMSFLTDFRVLYFRDEAGRSQRLDLGQMKSLEFMPRR